MFRFIYALLFFVGNVLIYYTESETLSTNQCVRLETYTENKTAPHSQTIQEPKRKFCFRLPSFSCTTYETKTVWSNRTEIVERTRMVEECCVGYEEINGTCKPICEKECIYGNCVSPDRCLCEPGWSGIDCTEKCDENHYGHDCDENCLCQNGATCNRMNGTCSCAEGFSGIYCESNCPLGSFGNNCENICKCKNGAACKMQDEGKEYTCFCKPGYMGKFCEMKCPEGTFGEDCKNICVCEKNNTEFCNHLDGQCNCLSGYKGKECNEKCDADTWGVRCENSCECGYNVTIFEVVSKCNHITGDCNCLSGWQGPQCTEKCPADTWGKHCLEECRCLNNSTCDPETGKCLCSQGWLGSIRCSIPCPDGWYGFSCNFTCDCQNNETCYHVSGECICSSNGNDTTCLKGSLNSSDDEDSLSTILLILFITMILIIILCAVLVIIGIYNRKSNKCVLEDIDFDESSTANVIENQVLPEFSSQQFMNKVYGECELHACSSASKSTAHIIPIRSSMNNQKCSIQKDCETMNEKNASAAESKNFVNLAFEALFSSKENKGENGFSANAVVKCSTSKENPELTDEKGDKVSLYRISIYDDAGSPGDNIYANPDEILNDRKDGNEN